MYVSKHRKRSIINTTIQNRIAGVLTKLEPRAVKKDTTIAGNELEGALASTQAVASAHTRVVCLVVVPASVEHPVDPTLALKVHVDTPPPEHTKS